MVRATSARPRGGRAAVPAKMTSSMVPPRSDLAPCSPITQARASTTLDLPEPLGPTTQVMPGSKVKVVAEANDLNPRRVSVRRYGLSLGGAAGQGAEGLAHRPGNHRVISRSAEAGESEPCTMFWVTVVPWSLPRSPRMLPGAAAVGSVAPAIARNASITRWPSTTAATTGPEDMNSTNGPKKDLPACSA